MQKFKTLFLLIALLASFSFGAAWTGANSEPESTQTIDGKKFYVITTPEELAWVAKQVNAGNNSINAVLANDIVFGKDTASVNTEYAWTPIGKDSAHVFRGILDGAGYSIYGVWTDSIECAGLVGVLDSAGVVKNVNMKRDSINSISIRGINDAYAGGIVGYNGGTVSNCTNGGSVSAASDFINRAGGIVGYNGGTVSDCTNSGSVSAASDYINCAGGIVGNNDDGTVSDCTNSGSVSAAGSYSYAGGIVGYNDGGTVSGDCANAGSVSAIGSLDSSGTSYAGGIVGNNDDGTVSDCTNEGNLNGSSSSSGSTALHVAAQPRFNLQVQNRTIWVQNARMGESFAVFDVQGHVLRRGVVNSTELFLSVQNAGAYIVRVGTETMRVRVK